MWPRLDERIASLLLRGWNLSWRAVRRRLNAAADELATAGVVWASGLARQGSAEETRLTWARGDAAGDGGLDLGLG